MCEPQVMAEVWKGSHCIELLEIMRVYKNYKFMFFENGVEEVYIRRNNIINPYN